MSKLKTYKFSQLYSMSSGISSKPEQAGHGNPFLSFSTVFNNYFLPDSLNDLMDTSEIEQETYSILKGDIFLTRTSEVIDELGMSSVALKDYPKATYSGFLKRLRPTQTDVSHHKYMAFYLRSKLFRKTMTNNAVLTLRASLNENIFSYLDLILPEYKQQVKIGDLLYLINSKIELNHRINAELESLAKTIYDYWFVQFDFPNADGKPYKSSGGEMVYVEELKREIPAGWRVDSLWKIANYFNGLPMQNNRPIDDNYLRVIKIREMNEGFSENTEFAKADIPKEAIVEDGDILFSWSATLDVKMWTQGKGALNQHIFKVTSNKFPKTFYYYELKNYLNHFKMMAERRKTTMGHITQEHLKQSRIVIPPNELVNQVHTMLTPKFEKRILLDKENQQLTQLRDWLLPMLMNGQVSIK